MKLLIAVGWTLVILVAFNISIAHAQDEAILTVSPVSTEQATEEITPEALTSTWTPSPTFTSVPEAIPTSIATATASWTPLTTDVEVALEALTQTNTLEVVLSQTTPALTTTPSTTAILEPQDTPTIEVTVSPTLSSTALLPITTSVANTPTPTPREEISSSTNPTSASQPSPTLEISISPTFQPTELATTTSTVSPVTLSPSPTALPSVSPLDLNFYIEGTLDPVVMGGTFEFHIMASEAFNATGLATAGICAYDDNFLSFADDSTLESGTWHFRIAPDLNEDGMALASTNVTAITTGQSTVTCVLQRVNGQETISSFQAVEVQVIAPLQLSVAISTHALHPINATLSNAGGTVAAPGTMIEGGIHFNNLVPGVYILRVTQPEHLPAITEIVLEDTALNLTCELIFGDLDGDEYVDDEDLVILQNVYHSLFDLRALATNLYFQVSPPCAVETQVVAVPITNDQNN